jgi:hypothetical protein
MNKKLRCSLRMRGPLQSAAPFEAGGRQRTLACRFACLRWSILTLWALWTLSAPCLASEKQPPSTSQEVSTSALSYQGGAIADLDGDGRLDVAVVRSESRGPHAFQYRIELALTTRVAPSSFSFFAEEGGLRIVPRDVDGDGDLDLVITSAWSLAPVGVWINDGHGGFTQGDPTAYPRSIWTEGPGISSDAPEEKLQATVPPSYRSYVGSSLRSCFCNQLASHYLPLLQATARPSWGAMKRPSTRAPPRSLLRLPS